MKRVFYFIVVSLLISGCTDLSEVNGRLDDHEKRLKNLENLVANANSTIKNLQDLLDAEAKKVTIDSFKETPNGYVLYMSDGSQINLSNGKDGTSPVIGIREENDVLYWTINGEFMLDVDGNKIKAEGQDGINGVTPKIRVDGEGYWEVSIDGGKTWQAITDESGQKVKAVGSDATIDLVITEDENAITIVYNGNTFVIPKEGGNTDPEPNPTNKIPLEYVVEFDLNKSGDGFATSHDYNESGFFSWDEVIAKYNSVTIDGVSYRAPTSNDWLTILPEVLQWGFSVDRNVPEEITFNGITKTYTADYYCVVGTLGYAIKFKTEDNLERVAYRYERIIDPNTDVYSVKITSRFIGDNPDVAKVEDVSLEAFWNSNNSNDVTRLFSAGGVVLENGDVLFPETDGNYWSTTKHEFVEEWVHCFVFYPGGIGIKTNGNINEKLKIRLFSSK